MREKHERNTSSGNAISAARAHPSLAWSVPSSEPAICATHAVQKTGEAGPKRGSRCSSWMGEAPAIRKWQQACAPRGGGSGAGAGW